MENQLSQWELYKLLKEEYKHYLDQAENLWRTKFIAIAAFISLSLLNEKLMDILEKHQDKANEVTALGMLIIPVLAFVIDLKILETGVHLRNISEFILNHFNDLSLAQDWERENWGKNKFTILRKWTTLSLSIGVSLLIFNLCLILISTYIKTSWTTTCVLLGIIVNPTLLVVTTRVSKILYGPQRGTNLK